jgi:predicted GIY-YIG superfamily endonuclease
VLLRQSPAHDGAGFLRNATGVRLAVSSDFDASGERAIRIHASMKRLRRARWQQEVS